MTEKKLKRLSRLDLPELFNTQLSENRRLPDDLEVLRKSLVVDF